MRLWVLYAEGLNDNHKYQEETDTHVVYTSKFNSQKEKIQLEVSLDMRFNYCVILYEEADSSTGDDWWTVEVSLEFCLSHTHTPWLTYHNTARLLLQK